MSDIIQMYSMPPHSHIERARKWISSLCGCSRCGAISALKTAGSQAADALEKHSHGDAKRTINVDGHEESMHDVVAQVIADCVSGMNTAQSAIDSAQ